MKITFEPLRKFKITSFFLFSIGSVISLILIIVLIFQDSQGEWVNYQKRYKSISLKNTENEQEIKEIKESKIEIKQLVLNSLNRIDRCISCHISADQPQFKEAKQPLTTHPGSYLENHPVEKFGCTICHEGLAMATTAHEAHGDDDPSLHPMLRGVFIQASCGKCHNENKYSETSVIGTGKRLFSLYGCRVCHKLYKSGGTAGPDLTQIGGKKYFDVSWGENYQGKKLLSDWLVSHFKNPSYYYPSKMMDFKMTDENAIALAVYMLSLVPEEIPEEYVFDKKNNIGN